MLSAETTTLPESTVQEILQQHTTRAKFLPCSKCGGCRRCFNIPGTMLKRILSKHAKGILGDSARYVSSVTVGAMPGAHAQPWHTDTPKELKEDKDDTYGCMFVFALTPVKTGFFEYVPDSEKSDSHDGHVGGERRIPEARKLYIGTVGGGACFDTCVIHRGGKMSSAKATQERVLLFVTFMRSKENKMFHSSQ